MQLPSDLPAELFNQLQAELLPNETILWASQPLPVRWTPASYVKKQPIYKRWFLLIPPLQKFMTSRMANIAQNLLYVVTNQRVMIISAPVSKESVSMPGRFHSIEPKNLLQREMKVEADNSGDLTFPLAPFVPILINGRPFPKETEQTKYKVGFYGIPNVKDVDELIRRTFETKAE